MQLISKSIPQFKANLHSHTVLSDGELTPEEMVEAYKTKGYSVLAITDHEAPYDHSNLSDPDFLLLTGWEAYIRRTAECKVDNFGPEIHMNLLAKEPHNVTYVAYDPNYCKYMPHELAEQLPHTADELGPRQYNIEYVNQFIRAASQAGYLVTYNHPVWSMEEPERILAYEGFFSLEIFNTGSMMINGQENNLALYERLIRHGKQLFVHGADDNHNKVPFNDLLSDSFGAWTMICAEKLTYSSIINALEQGNFYASNGPHIYEVKMEGKHVHVECSDAQRIILCMSEKKSLNVYLPDGTLINQADFDLPEEASWFYMIIMDSEGHQAVTHAFSANQEI